MIQIYNSVEWEDADGKEKHDPVIMKFKERFNPKSDSSALTELYRFNGTTQGKNATLDSFITRLRNIVKECEPEEQKN